MFRLHVVMRLQKLYRPRADGCYRRLAPPDVYITLVMFDEGLFQCWQHLLTRSPKKILAKFMYWPLAMGIEILIWFILTYSN